MTPDYDLGTVEGIVRTVEAMEIASYRAREWMSRRGSMWAAEWATEAAHHARRLQGVADAYQWERSQ